MDKHGMRWNANNLYRGYAQGTGIFDLTYAEGMKSIMLVGKEKLRLITEPETTEDFEVYWNEALISKAAIEIIPSDFDLMFIHFPTPDIRGHKYGWMTNSQFAALREGDDALGKILAALDENGMRETTLVIVTADHGGHDRTHDGTRIEDYLIPWIISGPGIIPRQLTDSVRIMDTAATAAYALGLPIPPEWDGIPVYEAFGIPAQDAHYNSGACE
jgi:predicted AlkP superfamily pyrophosphatase or phosphodiesterase